MSGLARLTPAQRVALTWLAKKPVHCPRSRNVGDALVRRGLAEYLHSGIFRATLATYTADAIIRRWNAMPEPVCECNGGKPCACPDCDCSDCAYRHR